MDQESRERELTRLREAVRMYELIFNSIHHGAMVTDSQGNITHFNKPYGQFLGLDTEEYIGRHCTESVENTRMHIVAQTGKAEINFPQKIKGQSMVVQRIPIRQDGKLIAVYGQVMFKDVRDVGKLAKKLSLLESKVKLYEQELINLRSTRYTFKSIIGRGGAMRGLKKEALKAAANDLPVLITGESGTGKELFAQAIHQGSPRKMHPFVRINCATIPRDLLESELFGYEKGAFTGAGAGGKPGKFELAHRGTLFLDEIGDLPLEMQPKLLRVLEEKEFERVGGTAPVRSDFRVVAATNQNLEEMIAGRAFRSDLFYRLNVIPLRIPPLRERRGDILEIARHLLGQMAGEMALAGIDLDPEAQRVLRSFAWPGNVRELSNVLERAVFNLEGDTIRASHLPLYLHREAGEKPEQGGATIKSAQAQAEQDAIRIALKEVGYNKALAARRLGIHRTLLYKKMKKYGLPLRP
ncbi:MAG: sigma 54-interacting transcriptional regulator [Desulfarculus sp.]|nr:sigma 54-interacting transcriptional regulator [Pseudomonadota bacterium]MBV1718095.1 sigma 54-interacting transcriptional regulator [Desulfarculus sp.]MBU4574255.1 sigma 54-interacting transcriptional regulator [Pseudomonadota bacterium]MBU4597486.1 sigma 54-interacting transcriptional regulator [Pseudomonadota bacterium]MBV1737362.1 sigma 54-interacting transcriptional regulator [Desulfarculus sp.]